MKILILNYEFPPMGGGAGRATYNIAKELAQLGHQVDVLTSRLPGESKEEKVSGFRVIRVYSWRKGIHDCGFRGALSYVVFAIPRLFSLTRNENYNVLHYFFGLPTGFLSLLPGPHKKTPYLVSLRGSDVPSYDLHNKILQRVHQPLLPLTRRIWKKAKRVVALSESLKATAKKTNPQQNITVIPNGIEPELFNQKSQVNKTEETFKLITVSRLIERKGIQHVLHALAELKDKNISLLIIGSGNYKNQLENLAKELSLNGKVTFSGYCDRETLPEHLNSADAFILPSMAEAFGMVFIEAMACGLPIIAADVGGVPDYVRTENGILVAPGNINEIKSAIIKLKNNPELRQSMAAANSEKALREYGWKKVAESYLAIYQE